VNGDTEPPLDEVATEQAESTTTSDGGLSCVVPRCWLDYYLSDLGRERRC
jgi:hypothetical protein